MKLKDCLHGVLVQDLETKEIGMVVGITNCYSNLLTEEQKLPENAIPLVKWQSGREFGIHHNNIQPLK